MELLIPGLLLVALMVYASTKIKRVAAEAFEPERIESERYVIDKPQGFLNVLNRDPGLELDVYSKEFGPGDGSGIRAARLELRIYPQRTVAYASNALGETVNVNSDLSEIVDGRKYRLLEADLIEDEIAFRELYKLAETDGKVFELKLKMIDGADDEVIRKAEQMASSFEIK